MSVFIPSLTPARLPVYKRVRAQLRREPFASAYGRTWALECMCARWNVFKSACAPL